MDIGGADRAKVQELKGRRGYTGQQSIWMYRLLFAVFTPLIEYWVRCFRAIDVEKVPRSGGAFLICNHASGMDPFLLSYPIPFRMVRGPGKKELFASPVWGTIMRKMGMFPLQQNTTDTGAVRAMVELYRNGRIVVVYPEGGRSETGELQPFFPDFARLVLRLKAPLIPAAIAGAGELLPIGSLIPRRKTPVVVQFGDQFDLSEFYGREITDETAQEAAQYMRAKVAKLLEAARRERNHVAREC